MKKNNNAINKLNEELVKGLTLNKIEFNDIPKFMLTKELIFRYFEITKNLSVIPSEYYKDITEDMVKVHINHNKNDIKWLISIPLQFVTKDMVKDHFNTYKSLEYIHDKLIEKDMFMEVYNATYDIRHINYYDALEWVDEKMANKYWDKFKDLNGIPEKFITEEMVLIYFYKNISTIRDLSIIPKKFINERILNDYYKSSKYFSLFNIPEELINEKMVLKAIKHIENIQFIPEKFLDRKIVDKIFLSNLYSVENLIFIINIINDEYISKKVAIEIFNRTKNLKYVPERYLNEKMVSIALRLNPKQIQYVPDYFINISFIKDILK